MVENTKINSLELLDKFLEDKYQSADRDKSFIIPIGDKGAFEMKILEEYSEEQEKTFYKFVNMQGQYIAGSVRILHEFKQALSKKPTPKSITFIYKKNDVENKIFGGWSVKSKK